MHNGRIKKHSGELLYFSQYLFKFYKALCEAKGFVLTDYRRVPLA